MPATAKDTAWGPYLHYMQEYATNGEITAVD